MLIGGTLVFLWSFCVTVSGCRTCSHNDLQLINATFHVHHMHFYGFSISPPYSPLNGRLFLDSAQNHWISTWAHWLYILYYEYKSTQNYNTAYWSCHVAGRFYIAHICSTSSITRCMHSLTTHSLWTYLCTVYGLGTTKMRWKKIYLQKESFLSKSAGWKLRNSREKQVYKLEKKRADS